MTDSTESSQKRYCSVGLSNEVYIKIIRIKGWKIRTHNANISTSDVIRDLINIGLHYAKEKHEIVNQ